MVEHGEHRGPLADAVEHAHRDDGHEPAHVAVADAGQARDTGQGQGRPYVEAGPEQDPRPGLGRHHEGHPLHPGQRPDVGEGEGRPRAIALADELGEGQERDRGQARRPRDGQGETSEARSERSERRAYAGSRDPPQQEEREPQPREPGHLRVAAENLEAQHGSEPGQAAPVEGVLQPSPREKGDRHPCDGLAEGNLALVDHADHDTAARVGDAHQETGALVHPQEAAQASRPEDQERAVQDEQERQGEVRLEDQVQEVRRVEGSGLDVREERAAQAHVRVPEGKAPGQDARHEVGPVDRVHLDVVFRLEDRRRRQVEQADKNGREAQRQERFPAAEAPAEPRDAKHGAD